MKNKKRIRRITTNHNKQNVIPTVRKPRGRQTKYNGETFPVMANSVCRNTGADNNILADMFGVGPKTLGNWLHKHQDFKQAVIKGRDEYDTGTVERRSLEKALGYKYTEETHERKLIGYEINPDTNKLDRLKPIHKMVLTKIEHKEQTPDNTLLIFWLKNRNHERWRDINRVEKTIDYPNGQPQQSIENTVNLMLNNADEKTLALLDKLISIPEIKNITPDNKTDD